MVFAPVWKSLKISMKISWNWLKSAKNHIISKMILKWDIFEWFSNPMIFWKGNLQKKISILFCSIQIGFSHCEKSLSDLILGSADITKGVKCEMLGIFSSNIYLSKPAFLLISLFFVAGLYTQLKKMLWKSILLL